MPSIMASPKTKARYDVSSQVKDAIERGDWAEVARILSECSRRDSDSVMTQLVSRDQWDAVKQVIRCVGDEERVWDIGSVWVKNNTLLSVAEGNWRRIGEMPFGRFLHSTLEWILQQACTRAKQKEVVKYILPHCADDQLDSVLLTLVKRRLWRAVREVLIRGVSDYAKLWAVVEACGYREKDPGDYFGYNPLDSDSGDEYPEYDQFIIGDILRHCDDDHLDSVMTTLVERRLWWDVADMLKRGVSDTVKHWAVMEACKYCYDDFDDDCYDDDAENDGLFLTDNILPYCADERLDLLLTPLVERRLWLCTEHVLERIAGGFNEPFGGQTTCDHCRSADIFTSNTRVNDSDGQLDKNDPPQCADDNQDSLAATVTHTETCTAVRNVSGREVSDAQRREIIKAAFQSVDENTLIKCILPYYVYDSIHSSLKILALRGFWSAFCALLHYFIVDTLYMWAVVKDRETRGSLFWDMVRNPCDGVKDLTPAMWRSVTWSGLQRSLKQLLDWDTPLCEVLCESLLAIVKEIWLCGREREIDDPEHRVMETASSTVEHLHQKIAPLLMKYKTCNVSKLLSCTESLRHEYAERRSKCFSLIEMYFIQTLVHQYYKRKAWTQMTDAILVVLTTVPVVPDVQSVALRVMLRHKRWDVIRHACLSGVCEQDRRQLFQAAVKQRQWSAVKRWSDHTLYHDQRGWALGEARQEKRWDVYLKLADHGLSEWERVGVLFRVAIHADWKLVRRMLRTYADVTDMIELLHNATGLFSKLGAKKYEQRINDLKSFKANLIKDTNGLRTLKNMNKRGKWWVVLHNIRHNPNLQHARRALKAAVSSEAWQAVMQLMRLETDVTRRDALFRDMFRLRQWAVCRELLQQGVSCLLCLELLPGLMEHSQWTLVAMVMECPMDGESRRNIIHQAMMMREGSVVWQCINNMHTRLSVDERDTLFQLSFNREVWQAVKPLIEEKDLTGIRHRNTALLEAIEQHQWDVVDHCQRHHADINMKDDDGHTPIHRAARKGDWDAVKELTTRGGDPNLLDRWAQSVLQMAIRANQWEAVKLLIEFHGDIHQALRYSESYATKDRLTPLGMLINARQEKIIELTLFWCPDQWKGVNERGETALHAAFLSGWFDLIYYLMARKVDPLAVTKTGHTALCYAVLCKDCPQRMVAECIKWGFSTHQPHITDTAPSDWRKHWRYRHEYQYPLTYEDTRLFLSPLMLAAMSELPVVVKMLYESGACSNRQLFLLDTRLDQLTKYDTDKGLGFQEFFSKCVTMQILNDPPYRVDGMLIQQSADYLREMCSTPRSLVSTCRLVISHCLTLSKTRLSDIAQLPLSRMMKNYLMFSDLTDPDFSYGILTCRTEAKSEHMLSSVCTHHCDETQSISIAALLQLIA